MVATTEQQLLVAILSSLLQLLLDAEQRWFFFHPGLSFMWNSCIFQTMRSPSHAESEVMKTCSEFLSLCGLVLGFWVFLGFWGFFVLMLCSKPSRMVFSLEILTQWANDCKYKTCRRLTEESEMRQAGSYV